MMDNFKIDNFLLKQIELKETMVSMVFWVEVLVQVAVALLQLGKKKMSVVKFIIKKRQF